MTNPTLDATLTELSALRQFFTNAMTQLAEGKVVDMSGIDRRVAAVCQTVQTAAAAQQQLYLPELTVLIELLSSYERDLRALQALVAANANDKTSNT